LSREEDRIERELPGLYDARNLCDAIIPQLRPIRHFYGVVKAMISGLAVRQSPSKLT
jgi:hypothetical protein